MPDWVIRAQFGHVSPAMLAVYSHVRSKELNEAAQALEPDAWRHRSGRNLRLDPRLKFRELCHM